MWKTSCIYMNSYQKRAGGRHPKPPRCSRAVCQPFKWSHTAKWGMACSPPTGQRLLPESAGHHREVSLLVSWVRKHLMSHWVHLKPFLHYNYYSSSLGRPTREEGLTSAGVHLPSQLCPAGWHFPTLGAAIHTRDHFIYGDWPKEKIPWKQNDLPFYLLVWYHL